VVFQDELGSPEHPAEWPESYVLGQILLQNPNHPILDDRSTPQIEDAVAMLHRALDSAEYYLAEWKKDNGGKEWKWFEYNNVTVQHLLRLAPLGHDHLYMGGNAGIVNATRKNTGASWRMVVELGPEVKAWGIYPGGPSGNPGSKHYDSYVAQWAAGQYNELHLYRTAKAAKGAGKATHEFQPVQP
jgi:penicillin amidase